MVFIIDLLTNMVLIIPVVAWTLAQLIKVIIVLVREHRLNVGLFLTSGGMPSSHAALVSSLATVVAIIQGVNSVSFAIAAILAMVVMYDAAGVRRATGRQAVVLNRLLKDFRERRPRDKIEQELREFIGHTPIQVIIGAILGICFTWLWLSVSIR